MTTIENFAQLVVEEKGLVVMTTLRADLTMQSTVVNAGVMDHPVTGVRVVALVARGNSHKLAHLRARPQTTITMRAGWQWITVEGEASMIGPDDPADDYDAERIRVLLREVFSAAGGEHDNWAEYDRVMLADRRCAVFVTPTRVYSNG